MAVAQFKANISSHLEASLFLGGRSERTLAHNTAVWLNASNGATHVRYHRTDIVSFYPSGAIVLRSGGYETSTTRERIRKLLPDGLALIQEKREWYLEDTRAQFLPDNWSGKTKSLRVDFADGMLILPNASLHGLEAPAQ
jgi:hypothetical protein